MKRFPLILLFAAATAPASRASEPRTLTLPEALAIAYEKNIDLRLARLSLDQIHALYRQAVATGLPQVGFDGSYTHYAKKPIAFFGEGSVTASRENVVNAAIGVEQPIFHGGRVLHSIKAAARAEDAGEQILKNTDQNVALTIKQLFYAALLSSTTALIQEDNLASTQNHLRTIRERYRQGIDSDLIVQRQDVEVANAKATLIAARNLHEMALISLQQALTLEVDRPIEVLGDLRPPSELSLDYTTLVRLAIDRHPGLSAARAETAFYEHKEGVTRADFYPRLSLVGRWGWRAESEDTHLESSESAPNLGGGLALSYPIFTGGGRLAQQRQSNLDTRKAREREAQLERSIRVDVRRQWLNVREAFERAQAQESAIGQARSALRATEIRYKAGEASLLDLNDATFALNLIRTRYTLAAHDYWTSLASLEKAIGGPIPGEQP